LCCFYISFESPVYADYFSQRDQLDSTTPLKVIDVQVCAIEFFFVYLVITFLEWSEKNFFQKKDSAHSKLSIDIKLSIG